MILKIDHIAASSSDFDRDIEAFKRFGYRLEFIERNVKNLEIKRRFLSGFSEKHDLAYLGTEYGLSLELTNHRGLSQNKGYVQPLFEGGGLNKVIVEASDTEDGMRFWELFGFHLIGEQRGYTVLKFSPVLGKGECALYLKKVPGTPSQHFLNDAGWNCIAFLAKSPREERARLKTQGADVTDIGRLSVHGQALDIFFVAGPNGELVEVIGRSEH